jgi:hypothetical protein
MKTLIYTSIYSNLWGTEFGGRPSREYQYKSSFYNILNINADKFICFTSKEELPSLEKYFYLEKKVDKTRLEFIVFDLKQTKHFEAIDSKKNIELMKQFDRCFEIQYNKFFWLELIENLNQYDRVFWVDAGLSHSGLFPENFSFGPGYDKYFWFDVFNENFLDYLVRETEEKIIIVGKENTGEFYWSKTLPRNYYNSYNSSYHIIGGFFGGKVNKLLEFKTKFEDLLLELLKNENQNYMEELIMSCLYFNYTQDFNLLTFQDWYERPNHKENAVKYFFNLFDSFRKKEINKNEINPIKKILDKKYPKL